MFTGIVETQGVVHRIEDVDVSHSRIFEIESDLDADKIDIGDSIAHAGCCLSVLAKRKKGEGMVHRVQAMEETLEKTTLKHWRCGDRVNLESSLRYGEEMGGHLVTGHIDGLGLIADREERGGSVRLSVTLDRDFSRFIARKGSVCIDGVSLTVIDVQDTQFWVDLITHTQAVTSLGDLRAGAMVNIEIDLIARYLERLLGKGGYG